MSFGYQVLGFGSGAGAFGPYTIEWLVIGAGAAGGGGYRSGGAGAGGYRNSYASEQSGALSSTETPWTEQEAGDGAITVTIGTGGTQTNTSGGVTGPTGGSGGVSSIVPIPASVTSTAVPKTASAVSPSVQLRP